MYRKCVTDISIQHQRQAEAALLELMLQQPYGDITVTALCRRAGITRRVFYHLFSNKQDVLYALVDHTILNAESFRPELQDQALRFFLYWREQRDFLDAMKQNGLTGIFLERAISSILQEDYDVWKLLQAEGSEERQDIIVFNFSGIMGMVFSWHSTGFQKSPEQMAALLNRLMNYPLAKHK